jgi:hypothetical protein
MEKGGYVGIVFGIILLIIGILGFVDIDYLANTYMAGFFILLGIISFICAGYFGKK